MLNKDISPTARLFLLGILFLSGANGLMMEIVFRRQLLLSLGVTHYSVATVLTVFMAGLAIGSFLFGRLADHIKYPIKLYGLLEVGVGLSGLLLIAVFSYLDPFYVKLQLVFGSAGSPNILLKLLPAAMVLLIPTTLMGGTLPVIGKALANENQSAGSPLGLLYGINTFGGVVGVIGATFFLLGTVGAMLTLAIVSIINTIIGLVSLLIFGKIIRIASIDSNSNHSNLKPRKTQIGVLGFDKISLAAFFLAGFAALSLEVHWTRILAYVVGSHGYAFGIILAAFLCGIALGSTLASRFADRLKRPVIWLGLTQLMIAGTAFTASIIMFRLRGLTGWLTLHAGDSWDRFITAEMVILFALLLAPTFCMGAVFPLVMTVCIKTYKKLGQSVGNAYMLNTLGSILGAFFAGFIFIPYLGITRGLKLTLLISILGGAILFLNIRSKPVIKICAMILIVLLGGMVWYRPIGYRLQYLRMGERLIFYDESSSATVSVREDEEGGRMLSVNGLDEVPVDPASLLTFRVLAHLPMLLHPSPLNVMVLSLGGAITTGSVARHPLEQIDAVELCPPVVKAAGLFESWNHGVLDDPRLQIILQDGRNHLLTTQKKYDVITADATHPWSADSWILYTKEMYRLVRSRLTDAGIFCQWVPLHWMSIDDFKCVLRTLRTEFPHLSLWYTGSYVVALGSQKPITPDISDFTHRMQLTAIQEDLASVGIDSPASLLGLYLLANDGIDRFVGAGPLNTDDFAYLEHSASRCFGRETTPENLAALMKVRQFPDFLLKGNRLDSRPGFEDDLRRLFHARDKTMTGRISTYKGDFAGSVEYYKAALAQAPTDGVTKILLKDALSTLASAWANNGDRARHAGKIKEAVSIYNQALKFDDNAPRAHNGLGLVYFARGDYGSALRHFDSAVQQYPKQAQIRFNRTLALLKLKRLAEARQEIAAIKELETGNANVFSAQLQKIMSQFRQNRPLGQ
jgi:spermidine synthase